jgi:hypothetical protein
MFRVASVVLGMVSWLAAVLGQPPRGMAQVGIVPAAASPVPSSELAASGNGWLAGQEAWERGELARRSAWQQQLLLDDQLRYRLGVPLGRIPHFEQALETAPLGSGWALLPPDDRESRYAYGQAAAGTRPPGPSRRSVFEPWPFLPGDIYGLPVVPIPVAHPIGQHEVQTAPRRWESRPYYAAPAELAASPTPDQNHRQFLANPARVEEIAPKKGSPPPAAAPEAAMDRGRPPVPPGGKAHPRGPKEY